MTQLVKYEAARHALQVAHNVDEVKDIRDKAQAMALYAKLAKDTALVEWATEIKVRAERRAGEMLAEIERAPAGRGEKKTEGIRSTLERIDVAPTTAHRWQKLAAVSERQFEQAVAAAKEVAGEVTTAAMLRAGRQVPGPAITPQGKPPARSSIPDKHINAVRRLDKVETENAALKEEIEGLRENIPELTAMASASEAVKNNEHFKKIVHLETELAQVKRSRDDFMRQCAELKKQVAYWKKQSGKKAA